MLWPILLLLLALALVFAEVFFPSFGMLGTGAVLVLLVAIFMAFQVGPTEGAFFLVGALGSVLGSIFVAYRLLPLTPFGKKFFLMGHNPTAEERRAVDRRIARLVGKEGRASSLLRPAGIAEIDGERVDVVSNGEPIPAGARVRVVQVDGNRVVVSQIQDGKP